MECRPSRIVEEMDEKEIRSTERAVLLAGAKDGRTSRCQVRGPFSGEWEEW